MIAGFSFVHDDRTYACVAEAGPGGLAEPWWWFTVTRDGNRYAPFRAAAKDTRASVQARIVAYYANHQAHRAMPENQHWARRQTPAAAAVAAKARVAAAKATAAAQAAQAAQAVAQAAGPAKAVAAKATAARATAAKATAAKAK